MEKANSKILSGAWRFGLLGVLAFSVWMAPLKLGTTVLYSSIAAVFLLGSGLLLYPLFEGEKRIATCYKVFLPGFIIYSVFWCLGWFGIRGHAGEIFGSAAGLAAFVFVAHKLYLKKSSKPFLHDWSIIFLFHTLGYTLGSMFSYGTHGKGAFASFMEGHVTLGGLLWGLCYGLGFGAGLGAVLSKKTD